MSKKRKKPGQAKVIDRPLDVGAPAAAPAPLEAYLAAHARYEALCRELDALWRALDVLWRALSPEERVELPAPPAPTRPKEVVQEAPPPSPAPDDFSSFLEGDSDLGALLPSRP